MGRKARDSPARRLQFDALAPAIVRLSLWGERARSFEVPVGVRVCDGL